jgi:hypothetical protein
MFVKTSGMVCDISRYFQIWTPYWFTDGYINDDFSLPAQEGVLKTDNNLTENIIGFIASR